MNSGGQKNKSAAVFVRAHTIIPACSGRFAAGEGGQIQASHSLFHGLRIFYPKHTKKTPALQRAFLLSLSSFVPGVFYMKAKKKTKKKKSR